MGKQVYPSQTEAMIRLIGDGSLATYYCPFDYTSDHNSYPFIDATLLALDEGGIGGRRAVFSHGVVNQVLTKVQENLLPIVKPGDGSPLVQTELHLVISIGELKLGLPFNATLASGDRYLPLSKVDFGYDDLVYLQAQPTLSIWSETPLATIVLPLWLNEGESRQLLERDVRILLAKALPQELPSSTVPPIAK